MSVDLSARSLYQRFFVGTSQIPREALRQLAALDHDRQEAVVAVTGGRVVGIAQYVRLRSSTGAELAVLVADSWQHHGLGRLLVTDLAELAAGRGITHFSALVLPENRAARLALASMWPDVRAVSTGDGHGYELPLHRLVDRDVPGTSTVGNRR